MNIHNTSDGSCRRMVSRSARTRQREPSIRRHPSLVLCILLGVFFSKAVFAVCDGTRVTLKVKDVVIRAEVARTPAERQEGLMNRKSLPPNTGMWFVFDGPTTATFWMRNTYISLDLIFVGKDLRIVHIHQNARPLDETPIASPVPYWYVLEVPAGFAKSQRLRSGGSVESFSKCSA